MRGNGRTIALGKGTRRMQALNLQRARRKALILSPTASHPQDYGNRHRVYQTTLHLKQQGYEVHFLLYPVEPDWRRTVPESARAMRAEWESFTIIPTSKAIQPASAGEYHLIDEWWDPTIEPYLGWLFEHDYFDVFVVNYAFLSKAFDFAPRGTVKVLETHDRFSGRKELLAALKAPLEAFYTTEDQERIALERSDIVVAIKDSEARFYETLTQRTVISVPFWSDRKKAAAPAGPQSAEGELRVGFVGALNVVNVANMTRFVEVFAKYRQIHTAPMTIDIAGEVCAQLDATDSGVRLLGRVRSLDDFYDGIDVIVAPMMLSTGLKIKVAEALAHGKAIVSTSNGFDGFQPADEFHTLESVEEVCHALVTLSNNRERLKILASHTTMAARLARQRSDVGYRSLANAITHHAGAVILVTDQPLGETDNVQTERLAQWCQLCAQILPTVAICLGDRPFGQLRPELERVDVIAIPSSDDSVENVQVALHELETSRDVVELIISVGGNTGTALWNALRPRYRHVTLDTWIPQLARIADRFSRPPASDLWVAPDQITAATGGRHVSTTAFRRLPGALKSWSKTAACGAILVLCAPDPYDRTGVEIIRSRATDSFPFHVVNLAASIDSDLDRSFFEKLMLLNRPQMVIAVGNDTRAISVCQSLAMILATHCIQVSSSHFPSVVKQNDGRIRMCHSYEEFAQHAMNAAELTRGASAHHESSGWMTYSRLIAGRLGDPASANATGTAVASDGIPRRGIRNCVSGSVF